MAGARIVAAVIGWRIALLALAAGVLVSLASSYIESTMLGLARFYVEDLRGPGGHPVLSIYSARASTPFTGLLGPTRLEALRGLPGVDCYWGETATPVLVGGRIAVLRGLPWGALDCVGARILEGAPPPPGSLSQALVGRGLAGALGLRVGDYVIVTPLFTGAQARLRVAGIVEAPSPYEAEILVDPGVARALRGAGGYTVVRVSYDPAVTGPREIAGRLNISLEGVPEALIHEAVLLVARGYARPLNPQELQDYFNSRLGVPTEAVALTALASDALLSLLYLPLAWLALGLRRRPLVTLVEQGMSTPRLRILALLALAPPTLAGAAAGLAASRILPGTVVMGYPVEPRWPPWLGAAHLAIAASLLALGVASWRAET